MKKMYYAILILGVCFLCYQAMSISKHGLNMPNAAKQKPAPSQPSQLPQGGDTQKPLATENVSYVSTSEDNIDQMDKPSQSPASAPAETSASPVSVSGTGKTAEVDIYLHKANVESVDKLVSHSKSLSMRVSEAQATFPETVSEVSAANQVLLADVKKLKREFDGITVQPCAQPTYKRMSQGLARFISLLKHVSTSPYIKQNALQNKHFVQAIDYDAARKACDAF